MTRPMENAASDGETLDVLDSHCSDFPKTECAVLIDASLLANKTGSMRECGRVVLPALFAATSLATMLAQFCMTAETMV